MISLIINLFERNLSSLNYQTVSYASGRSINTAPAKESLLFCVNKMAWTKVYLLCPNQTCSLGSNISIRFNVGIDKLLKDLADDTEHRYWSITLWFPSELHWLWDCICKCISPDLENFELMQEERKSCNQYFKAAQAWNIKYGQMKLGHGALPGFKLEGSRKFFLLEHFKDFLGLMMWSLTIRHL